MSLVFKFINSLLRACCFVSIVSLFAVLLKNKLVKDRYWRLTAYQE